MAAQAKQTGSKFQFKYSMAPIVSLSIGSPPQTVDMVLDTGSQLSWISCRRRKQKLSTTSFDPYLSSSFSTVRCKQSPCNAQNLDPALPLSCGPRGQCHYSLFYADGAFVEGNLVRERFPFLNPGNAPAVMMGCANDAADGRGILGMNLGRLSFASQSNVSRFSYCVPTRPSQGGSLPTGSMYFGQNPDSARFRYVKLMNLVDQAQSRPNCDPLAYTLPLQGIAINGKSLGIPKQVFRPDSVGAGQTFIDSGSEYTFLVDGAYEKLREYVVKQVGVKKLKEGFSHGPLDICFDGGAEEIGRLIGDMAFQFPRKVEIVVRWDRVLADVGGGTHCLGIGRSESLESSRNIIGSFHQQDHWVEFDLTNQRVGFATADCSRSSA